MEHDILGIHRDENYIVLEGWSLVSSVSFLCWQLTWLSIRYVRPVERDESARRRPQNDFSRKRLLFTIAITGIAVILGSIFFQRKTDLSNVQ
ncbi:hypothetical protein GLYMA_04G091000v4 [Glycine max]|uniref:Uncharacterized protein n=2 Tax=Glycine subgen. Soja TaxID=1462606 RepID=A0A0R0K661_SOYBN|nr:hypothetical protein GYH30_009404 [Glycine max]KRH62172.1 hypothetical protein GLYMA_04G091000v4 [Glycine max]